MNAIAQSIIDAHGGHAGARFGRCARGGALWGRSATTPRSPSRRIANGRRMRRSVRWPRAAFTGDRIALLDSAGRVRGAGARASFDGHTLETPWDELQLAFFAGCAMWTYLNAPFVLAWDGARRRRHLERT